MFHLNEKPLFNQKFSTMAEIHVQAKKKTGLLWFWIILFLLVLGAIVVYVMFRDNKQVQQQSRNQTSLQSNQRNTVYML